MATPVRFEPAMQRYNLSKKRTSGVSASQHKDKEKASSDVRPADHPKPKKKKTPSRVARDRRRRREFWKRMKVARQLRAENLAAHYARLQETRKFASPQSPAVSHLENFKCRVDRNSTESRRIASPQSPVVRDDTLIGAIISSIASTTIMQGRGLVLAITAGLMAAMASVCAKLAMTTEVVQQICIEVGQAVLGVANTEVIICDSLSAVLRLACFGGIFVFNALMWTFYAKSLQFCSSSIEASVINTGANFLFTALVGFFLFQERLSIKYWLGSCLILFGLCLIHKGSQDTGKTDAGQKVKAE